VGGEITVFLLKKNDEPAYKPHPSDPPALLRECPACKAAVGAWCGGFGDIHKERE